MRIFGFLVIILGYVLLTVDSFIYIYEKEFLSFQKNAIGLQYYFGGVCCSLLGIFILWKKKYSAKIFFATVFVSFCLLVFMLPNLSDDIYRYLWDGIACTKGYSPYEFLPKETIDISPVLYLLLNSPEYYSVYPPGSQYLFYFSAVVSKENIFAHFIIYKIFCAISLFIAILFAQKILHQRNLPSKYIYLVLNPLITTELIGQGHSEVFMITALVIAIYFYHNKNITLTVFFLTLATLVKLYPALFLGLLFRRDKVWKYSWICFLTSFLFFIPFYCDGMFAHIRSSLGLYTYLFSYNSAIFLWLHKLTILLLPETINTYGVALRICWVLFFVAYGIIFFRARAAEYTKVLFLAMFFYLFFNATVHPWYVTPLLFLCIFDKKTVPLILWSILIVPVYMFPFISQNSQVTYITIEYILLSIIIMPILLQFIIILRAWNKYNICKNYIVGEKLIDNGCGEGYLGKFCHEHSKVTVQNIDVLPLHQNNMIPFTLYDGKKIPFADDSFDTSICCLMLHHCESPIAVLKETIRVSKNRIIIFESTFESKFDLIVLTILDKIANFIRSYGRMGNEKLQFYSPPEWEKIFSESGLKVVKKIWVSRFVHKHVVYILDKQ